MKIKMIGNDLGVENMMTKEYPRRCVVCGEKSKEWITLYTATDEIVCKKECLRKKLIREGARER